MASGGRLGNRAGRPGRDALADEARLLEHAARHLMVHVDARLEPAHTRGARRLDAGQQRLGGVAAAPGVARQM